LGFGATPQKATTKDKTCHLEKLTILIACSNMMRCRAFGLKTKCLNKNNELRKGEQKINKERHEKVRERKTKRQ